MLDILSSSTDARESRLSNFTRREFQLDDVQCCSIEGALQALKIQNIHEQARICQLVGKEAKKAGQGVWENPAWLYWNDDPFPRDGREYCDFLMRLYDAVYEQDPSFREDLLATGHEELRHSIGKVNQIETILTEVEFLVQLYRLRARAYREPVRQLEFPGIRN